MLGDMASTIEVIIAFTFVVLKTLYVFLVRIIVNTGSAGNVIYEGEFKNN